MVLSNHTKNQNYQKEIVEKSNIQYEDALRNSGYKKGLAYENNAVDKNGQNEKKKRENAILLRTIHFDPFLYGLA